jgi:hypothetical protein
MIAVAWIWMLLLLGAGLYFKQTSVLRFERQFLMRAACFAGVMQRLRDQVRGAGLEMAQDFVDEFLQGPDLCVGFHFESKRLSACEVLVKMSDKMSKIVFTGSLQWISKHDVVLSWEDKARWEEQLPRVKQHPRKD